jgi:hypothetical protein
MDGIEIHYRLQAIIDALQIEHGKLIVLEDSMTKAEQLSRMARIHRLLFDVVRDLECISTIGDVRAVLRESIAQQRRGKIIQFASGNKS